MTLNNGWRTIALILSLVLSIIALGVSVNTVGQTLPDWVEIQEGPVAHGVDKFYRNAYFKGNIEAAGDLTVAGDTNLGTDLTLSGPVTLTTLTVTDTTTLGDAITDNINVYGEMRSYDGTDNWADVPDVSALDRASGWHAAYNITGWEGETAFQALFANTQVATTTASCDIYGAELKATLKGVRATGTTKGIGNMGKVVAKSNATLPLGYGFYSRLETDGADNYITSGANFMADLDNTGAITTSRVLYTEADTWTYGLDLSQATLTNDIVGQNEETITNSPNGEWDFGAANLDTSGAVQFGANDFYPIGYGSTGYAVDLGTSTVTDTLGLSLSNVTTPTIGLCTLAEDPDDEGAACSMTISGTTATLKLWSSAITTTGSAPTQVHWMIVGQE